MTLSKKSWHYKLYRKLNITSQGQFTEPTNFCSYFWFWVLSSMGVAVGLAMGGYVVFCMEYSAFMFVSGQHVDKKDNFASMGAAWWVIIGAALVVVGIVAIFKKDNFIKTFIKAFIGKYCPKIEWN